MNFLKKNQRNCGIDLLKILSMLMVITLHVLGKGNLLYNKELEIFSLRYNVLWILEIASFCAVNLYALSSGYVGLKAKHKYTNIFILWLEVVFYLLLISFIFSKFGIYEFSKEDFFESLFPVSNVKYWYFSAYFCLFFMMPILNIAIENLKKYQLIFIIFVLSIIFCVIPTVMKKDVFNICRGYHFFWLFFMYLIGGFFSKYDIKFKFMKISMFVLYLLSVYITFLLKKHADFMILNKIEYKFNFVEYNSPTIFLSSIFLFLVFANLKVNYLNKFISFVSKLTFSVYLIHEHDFIRTFFIKDKFSYLLELSTRDMVYRLAIIVFFIFLISIFIDLIRTFIFKILFIKKLFIRCENFICEKFSS